MKTRDVLRLVALGALTMTIFSADQAADARNAIRLDGQLKALQASRAIPGQLNYQGHLVNAFDSSAVNADLEMTFKLFDSEMKGAELWSETHSSVEVNSGLFQVLLGSVTSFPDGLFNGSTLWLQTEVGSEILTPRKPLVGVAYSQRAEDADHAAAAETSGDADHLEGYAVADLDGRWVNEEDLDHLDAADGDPSGAVHVDDDGRVGIGTASPLTELDVNGSVNAATYYGDGSNLTGISGTADADWTINGDTIYHETGTVGIGTASPTAPLTIGVVSGPDLQFTGSSNNTDIFAASEFKIGTSGSNNLHLMTDSNYRVTVTSGGGRMGIGTTLPYEKLHIHENAKGSCYTQFTNTATGGGSTDGFTVGINTDGNAFIYNRESVRNLHSGAGDATRMFIKYTGEVGIGTITPARTLDVNGDINAATYYGDGSHLTGITAAPDGDWILSGDNLSCAVAGSVSIGATPAYGKLAVYNPDGRAIIGEDGTTGSYGYVASGGYGLYGQCGSGYGVGGNSNEGTGVKGMSDWGIGVHGESEDSVGVYGYSLSDYGVYGFSNDLQAVYGKHSNGTYGYLAGVSYGMYAYSSSGFGARGNSSSGYGVWGTSTTGTGVYGTSNNRAIYGNSSGYAGYFDGDVHINGTLTGGKGATVIDHPLDPENRLLRQNFVESPENLWICRGTAQLDAAGEAAVRMPDYFAALTREDEATVSLTPVGKPFLAGYRWQLDGASFRVYGQPGGEVSWVVYADRDDPVIHQLAQPIVEEKGPDNILCDQGKLLYPEAYGYPESRGANYEEIEQMKKRAEDEME